MLLKDSSRRPPLFLLSTVVYCSHATQRAVDLMGTLCTSSGHHAHRLRLSACSRRISTVMCMTVRRVRLPSCSGYRVHATDYLSCQGYSTAPPQLAARAVRLRNVGTFSTTPFMAASFPQRVIPPRTTQCSIDRQTVTGYSRGNTWCSHKCR